MERNQPLAPPSAKGTTTAYAPPVAGHPQADYPLLKLGLVGGCMLLPALAVSGGMSEVWPAFTLPLASGALLTAVVLLLWRAERGVAYENRK